MSHSQVSSQLQPDALDGDWAGIGFILSSSSWATAGQQTAISGWLKPRLPSSKMYAEICSFFFNSWNSRFYFPPPPVTQSQMLLSPGEETGELQTMKLPF